jgi:hypothetical protein
VKTVDYGHLAVDTMTRASHSVDFARTSGQQSVQTHSRQIKIGEVELSLGTATPELRPGRLTPSRTYSKIKA